MVARTMLNAWNLCGVREERFLMVLEIGDGPEFRRGKYPVGDAVTELEDFFSDVTEGLVVFPTTNLLLVQGGFITSPQHCYNKLLSGYILMSQHLPIVPHHFKSFEIILDTS